VPILRVMKLLRFLLVASVLFLPQESSAFRLKHKESPAPVPTGDYVGSETCIACHDDSSKTLEPTGHQKLLANQEPAKNGCEACHGPGSKHLDGNGDVEKIFRFTGAPISQVQLRCAGCHSRLGEAHGHAKLNCLSCHSVHHAAEPKFILVKSSPDLCTGCHH
jgi:predicted CXXCH cytochrome family protein